MVIVFYCLILIILFLLILLLLIIMLPLEYKISLKLSPGLSWEVDTGLWKLLRLKYKSSKQMTIKLIILTLSFSLSNKHVFVDNKKKNKQNHPQVHSLKHRLELLIDISFQKELIKLIRDLFQAVKPQSLMVNGRVGFSEPHYTAWLMALIGIVSNNKPDNNTINLEPIWNEECVDVNIQISGQLMLLFIISKIISFLLNCRQRIKHLRSQPAG